MLLAFIIFCCLIIFLKAMGGVVLNRKSYTKTKKYQRPNLPQWLIMLLKFSVLITLVLLPNGNLTTYRRKI